MGHIILIISPIMFIVEKLPISIIPSYPTSIECFLIIHSTTYFIRICPVLKCYQLLCSSNPLKIRLTSAPLHDPRTTAFFNDRLNSLIKPVSCSSHTLKTIGCITSGPNLLSSLCNYLFIYRNICNVRRNVAAQVS